MDSIDNEQHFCQLDVSGQKKYFLLSKLFKGGLEGIDILLCDGEKAWFGEVSEEELTCMSEELKMEYKELVKQTVKALTRHNVGAMHFLYEIRDSTNVAHLTWKKLVPSENVKIQLGSIELKRSSNTAGVILEICQFSIKQAAELNDRICSLRSENERLTGERASALQRLEKLVNIKEEVEKDLYAKFVVILNEKKKQLKALHEEGEDFESAGPSTSTETGKHQSTKKSQKKDRSAIGKSHEDADTRHEENMSDDENNHQYNSNYNTDDDESSISAEARSIKADTKRKGAEASRSREEVDDLDLLLDDKPSDAKGASPVKRARQQVGSQQRGRRTRAAPSTKPVLPKVTSSEEGTKVDTRAQSSRITRSSSDKSPQASNRSEIDPDVEALLEGL